MDKRVMSAGLACFLAVQLAVAQPAAPGLTITVLDGLGAINNINQREPRTIVVQVSDEQNRPASKAAVTFTAPAQGASVSFNGSGTTQTVTADEQGRASVRTRPNRIAGEMEIRVNASHEGRTGRATITQFNMAVPKQEAVSGSGSSVGKILLILAIGGGAAAGAIIAGTRNSDSTSAAPAPITITPGAGTIGPPR